MRKVIVIQGPNLNLLGEREKNHYGSVTLEQIHSALREEGRKLGLEVHDFQSNHEGELVEAIQGTREGGFEAIIINPAAYTHTSVAIRDALAAVGLPYCEVHISNVHSREEFRKKSLVSDGASGIIAGFGPYGYTLALMGVHRIIQYT